jgi:hypothetical protein
MNSYRIQLAENTVVKKPKASSIIVATNYEQLAKLASSKFKINPKKHKVRFFVARKIANGKIGTEIKNQDDFSEYVVNDIMLCVSNGENFKGRVDSNETYTLALDNKINRPPRYPYPSMYDLLESKSYNNVVESIDDNCIVENINETKNQYIKQYQQMKIHLEPTKDKEIKNNFPIFSTK